MIAGFEDPRLGHLVKLSRVKLRMMIYMLTGHAPLRSMLHKMK